MAQTAYTVKTYTPKTYTPSKTVTRSLERWEEKRSQSPEPYSSDNSGKLSAAAEAIRNRDPFAYDPRTDALYRQAVAGYVRSGRRAMEDTLGRTVTLTGGYSNSYAHSAAQQAYGEYLQGIPDLLPQYYSLALDRYRLEGDRLRESYDILASLEDRDYSRYLDALDRYDRELEQLRSIYESDRDYDHGAYRDDRDFDYLIYSDDREAEYQAQQDRLAYEQWLQEMVYRQERDKIEDSQWQAEFDEDRRRYDQEWELKKSKSRYSRKTGEEEEEEETPVDRTPLIPKPSEQKAPIRNPSGQLDPWYTVKREDLR